MMGLRGAFLGAGAFYLGASSGFSYLEPCSATLDMIDGGR